MPSGIDSRYNANPTSWLSPGPFQGHKSPMPSLHFASSFSSGMKPKEMRMEIGMEHSASLSSRIVTIKSWITSRSITAQQQLVSHTGISQAIQISAPIPGYVFDLEALTWEHHGTLWPGLGVAWRNFVRAGGRRSLALWRRSARIAKGSQSVSIS